MHWSGIHYSRRLCALVAFIVVMLGAAEIQAATVTLSWNPNPEPDIAGYLISYGTSSGNYTTSVDVGDVTTWTVSLTAGFHYFFAAQAYDTAGLRSPMSTEASIDLSQTSAPSITSLSPSSGSVGTAVTISGANFGASQGTSTVSVNGTAATPTSWSASAIAVLIPNGTTTGPIVVTVNNVASNGATFTVVTSNLPAPWLSQDVGSPSVAGQATYSSGTFTVLGAGSDIWGSTDQFRFVYQPLTGDGEIVARVASVENKDAWSKAAVMIRGDLTANAAYAMAAVTSLNGTIFQSRSSAGGASTFTTGTTAGAPQWIRVVRSGNTLSGYYSADGLTWAALGTSTVTIGSTVYVGLAVTSHNPAAAATATFANVAVTTSSWLSQDIGNPSVAGQATYSSGTFTVLGAGSDIWGSTDQFRFVYQPLTGDGEIVARVASVENKDAWSKAAVMIRGDLTANAAYAMAAVTSLNGTIFQSRSSAGGASTFTTGTTAGAPQWIRVVRSGNTLSGYYSADGLTWAALGTSTVTIGSTVYVGLAVTSHNPAVAATATFTNVAVTGSPWLSQDIGNPSVAGQSTYSAGTFTVLGAGSDIWGVTDQFQFVYQPLTGDGEIVARVASVENENAWSKAAVMMRGDLTANAAYAMAAVTSLNGTIFQSRSNAGGASTFTTGTTAGAPQWIRVVRSGNTLAGYYSADGLTWAALGTSTVTIGSTVYVGLAVTSHNPAATATVMFTNITVSP